MSTHRCPQRQRRTNNNKRSYSDAEGLSDNDTVVSSPPTVIKYRAISISKVFDWEIDFMSIKHHYALKKDLTSDLAFPPLKIHMLLSFNFENDDENGNNSNSNQSSQDSNNNNNNNSNSNDDNKDECDIRLWLVVDHENERLNKHASFDFGVQYLRRRPQPNPAAAADSYEHGGGGGGGSSSQAHFRYNQRRRPHGYSTHSASSAVAAVNEHGSGNSNRMHAHVHSQTSRNSNSNNNNNTNLSHGNSSSGSGSGSSGNSSEEVWTELNAKQSHCASGSMWGFQIGKSLNELHKFCLPKEEKMLFRFNVEFITKCESQIGFHAPAPMIATQKFASRIEDMWKTGLFTDVIIECPTHHWNGHCCLCDDYGKMTLHAHDCNTSFDSLSHSPCDNRIQAAGCAAAYHQKSKIQKQKKTNCHVNKHQSKQMGNTSTNTNTSTNSDTETEIARQQQQQQQHALTPCKLKPKCKTKPSISMNINHGQEQDVEGVDDADDDEDDIDLHGDNHNHNNGHEKNHEHHENENETELAHDDDRDLDEDGIVMSSEHEHGDGDVGEQEAEQNALRRKHRFTKNSGARSGRDLNCLDDDDDDDAGMNSTYCISAHKSILSSVSSVFYAMLNCALKERDESRIVITDICYNTMYHLLSYAYSNQVTSECDLKALFAAAEKYQIYDLCHICLEKMESIIDLDTVCDLFRFLQRYQCNHHISPDMMKKLEAKLFEFMVENYPEFSKLESYRELKPKIESQLTMFMYQKQFGAIKT